MIGGLAHNLKTPVMSVSGCISAVEALVDECSESLGDPQVTEEDFREIYGEMKDWFQKMREPRHTCRISSPPSRARRPT